MTSVPPKDKFVQLSDVTSTPIVTNGLYAINSDGSVRAVGTPLHKGYVAGERYPAPNCVSIGSGSTYSANVLYGVPWSIGSKATFGKLWTYVFTAAAGSLYRTGIYSISAGKPSSILIDLGSVSGATVQENLQTYSLVLDISTVCLAWCVDSTSLALEGVQSINPFFITHNAGRAVYQSSTSASPSSALPSTFGTASIAGVGQLSIHLGF